MTIVNQKSSVKTAPHFAALVFTQITIPGDERSRTNPGHGYPAETRHIAEYHAFDSRSEMEQWVKQAESPEQAYLRRSYQIIEVKPCTVTANIEVTITQ